MFAAMAVYAAADVRGQGEPATDKLLRFVLRAFIPATEAPALVKIPTRSGICLTTDQRGFSPALNMRSRATTEFILVVGRTTRVAASGERDIFRVEPVSTVDCATGRNGAPLPARAAEPMTVETLARFDDTAQVVFAAIVRDPFHQGSATGELRYGGSLIYDTRAMTVSFTGTVSVYPAFEAYVETESGPKILFQVGPAPGTTPLTLYDRTAGTDRPIEVTVSMRP